MTQEETARIKKIKKFRTKRITVGRELSLDETGALLDNSSGPKISEIRDHAILSILIGTGMRRAEISSISFEGYDRQKGSLKIIGKGDKQRKVYMPDEVKQALDQWIEVRGNQTEGPIFVRIRRFGVIDTKAPLTPGSRRLDCTKIYRAFRHHRQSDASRSQKNFCNKTH